MTVDRDLIAHQNELLCRLRIEYQSVTDHMAGTHHADDLRFKEHVTSSLYQIGQLLETLVDSQY